MIRLRLLYSLETYNSITVEIYVGDDIKISEETVNKALMIAMNYLLENMEIVEQEEPE